METTTDGCQIQTDKLPSIKKRVLELLVAKARKALSELPAKVVKNKVNMAEMSGSESDPTDEARGLLDATSTDRALAARKEELRHAEVLLEKIREGVDESHLVDDWALVGVIDDDGPSKFFFTPEGATITNGHDSVFKIGDENVTVLSIKSPMGIELKGKREGETATIQRPDRSFCEVKVLAVC